MAGTSKFKHTNGFIFDWDTAGYQRDPSDNIGSLSYDSIFNLPSPSSNAWENVDNIQQALREAATSSYPGRTLILFKKGIYRIDETIVIDKDHGDVTLRGEGNTTIQLEPPSEDEQIFLIHGDEDSIITNRRIKDYDPARKTIIFDPTPVAVESNHVQSSASASDPLCTLQVGDYLRNKVPNDPMWNDTPNNTGFTDDILGQMVKIVGRNRTCTEFELQDNIDLIWDMATSASVTPYVTKILPVAEVGIENMRIQPSANNGFRVESINFTRAVNSWVKDVEMVNAININIAISQSHALEIRRNYIHHAQVHGDGGQGYGVAISGQSTYCLVIDNIFQRLQHAMQVNGSASRNVFAYNYSRDQYDTFGGTLGDISLHGTYPFGNLFEGNRVDRIHADNYFGSNEPYNTFLRNNSYYGNLKLEWTDLANVIANESNLLKNPKNGTDSILDEYATSSFGTSLLHVQWEPTFEKLGYHSDVSYLYSTRPGFISSEFSWSPLGPKVSPTGSETTQDIPARKRFFETNMGGQPYTNRWPVEAGKYLAVNTEGDWITVFTLQNGTVDKFFSKDSLFAGSDPTLKHMIAGDFNGDKIDDLAVNIDDDWITVFTIEGGGALRFYSNNRIFEDSVLVQHMIAGDFNGDGMDEIVLNVEGSDRIAVFSPEQYMRNSTVILYSGEALFRDDPPIKHMVAGDFNGDGTDEIAMNLFSGDDITVFGVKNGKPEILYSGNDLLPGSPHIKHMISGDFNGDGIDEIAVNFSVLSHDENQSVMSVTAVEDGHYDWITVFNPHNGTPNIRYSSNNVVPSNSSFRHLVRGYFYDPTIPPIAPMEEMEYGQEGVDDEIVTNVILEKETDPAQIEASDINENGRVDALDIQMSVNKQLQIEVEE